jgi:hypothetical protein
LFLHQLAVQGRVPAVQLPVANREALVLAEIRGLVELNRDLLRHGGRGSSRLRVRMSIVIRGASTGEPGSRLRGGWTVFCTSDLPGEFQAMYSTTAILRHRKRHRRSQHQAEDRSFTRARRKPVRRRALRAGVLGRLGCPPSGGLAEPGPQCDFGCTRRPVRVMVAQSNS